MLSLMQLISSSKAFAMARIAHRAALGALLALACLAASAAAAAQGCKKVAPAVATAAKARATKWGAWQVGNKRPPLLSPHPHPYRLPAPAVAVPGSGAVTCCRLPGLAANICLMVGGTGAKATPTTAQPVAPNPPPLLPPANPAPAAPSPPSPAPPNMEPPQPCQGQGLAQLGGECTSDAQCCQEGEPDGHLLQLARRWLTWLRMHTECQLVIHHHCLSIPTGLQAGHKAVCAFGAGPAVCTDVTAGAVQTTCLGLGAQCTADADCC